MPLCPPALQYWTEGNISALQILKGAAIFETLCSRLARRLAVGDGSRPRGHTRSRLWARIERYQPIVLTGMPTSSVIKAADNKHAWVRRDLGEHVEIRCCWRKRYAGMPHEVMC